MRFNFKVPSHFDRRRKLEVSGRQRLVSETPRPAEEALSHLFEPLTRAELFEAGARASSDQPHFTDLDQLDGWVSRRIGER